MPKFFVFAIVSTLAACAVTAQPEPIGTHLVAMCGSPPTMPGRAVAFDTVKGQAIVTMSRADYLALIAAQESALAWMDCVSHLEAE